MTESKFLNFMLGIVLFFAAMVAIHNNTDMSADIYFLVIPYIFFSVVYFGRCIYLIICDKQ